MTVTAPRAPRLRLHRETVRQLAVSRDAAVLAATVDRACNTSECDITLTCTQFNCPFTSPQGCLSL